MSVDEQRKLAAIMFTDMVGYSALNQRDEKLAQELLEEHRRLLRPIFPRFNGTEIKTIGDAFLVEFASALEAAQCAIEIQRTLAHRDADATADRQIQVRIGVHIGDVVHRAGDVYGDGVNIASRIEPVAGPGGICVSMDVERQVRNSLEARFEKLEPTDLKNISVPMDLFRIVLPWERSSADAAKSEIQSGRRLAASAFGPTRRGEESSDKSETGTRNRWIFATCIAVALVAATLLGYKLGWRNVRPPMEGGRNAGEGAAGLSTPATPAAVTASIQAKSVAVLPFENLSENKENAFFADGVQDEILTNLAKVADLKVISRTSVSGYRDIRGRNLRKIGEELGVAHVVEGSVQRAGNKVRVNAQLIDARNDAHLWAQTYDRDLADVFAIQSEIAKGIADQLQAKISPTEKAAIEKAPTTDLTAHDLYLHAQELFADTTDIIHAREKLPQAERALNEAVRRDPKFLLAWCLLTKVHGNIYWQGHDHTPARLDLANAAAQTALRLQPDAGEAHLALADYYYHGFRDYERARSELAIARRTLPNNAEVFEYTGYIDRRQGRWEEGTRNMERAIELDPRNFFTLQQIALTYFQLRRYADVVRMYDRCLTIVPGDPASRIGRARVALDSRADIRPVQETFATLMAEDPRLAAEQDDPELGLCERTPAAAARALKNFPPEGIAQIGVHIPHAYYEGVVARVYGDAAKAKAAFVIARSDLEKTLKEQPDFPAALSYLGVIDAGLGRKDEAIREGRRACELLPISKDSIDGPVLAANLAQIYIWTGEKDLAIAQIEAVQRVPNQLSYGLLKLHPVWDPLRGDPRFEKLLSSLAPK